jgi:hypothetical protein
MDIFWVFWKENRYFFQMGTQHWWFSQILAAFCGENSKYSFCLLTWNHPLFLKILPVKLFRKLVPLSGNRLWLWKLFKSHLWFWKLFKKSAVKIYQWQHRTSGTKILMRLSEQSLDLVTVFKEASIYQPKNFKTICSFTENTEFH